MITKFNKKPRLHLFNLEWERRRAKLNEAEAFGRRIGIFLHYLFVIPAKILYAIMLVIIFLLVNITHIATVFMFVLLVGGLGYVILTIGGNMP
jgi:hypothetical protein